MVLVCPTVTSIALHPRYLSPPCGVTYAGGVLIDWAYKVTRRCSMFYAAVPQTVPILLIMSHANWPA